MLTFSDFCKGPGGTMCRRDLGLNIDTCQGWDDIGTMVRAAMNNGDLLDQVKRLDGVLSTGERVVLHAILHATDYDRQTDELSGGRTWDRMSRASGAHLDAVLACIARSDK